MVATSSSVDKRESGTPALGTWGQAVLLLLAVVGVYFQTWVDIWPYWENKNATYTHGTLVAVVTLWLLWRARPAVNRIEPLRDARAVPVVLLLSAVWVLATSANVFIVYAALWPLLAFAALWAGLGLQAAYRFAFPLSFLYFAIPVWDYLKPPLQVITTTMAGLLTSLFGIPAAFDGPYVTLPTGTIFIAEDCSGAHFLCVALAVGVLAGVLRGDVLRTRILILIVAGLLSMAFNWLRILLIVLAYQHPGLRDALETMGHLTFGWWVFALDLVVFSLVLRFVPRSADEQAAKRLPDRTAPVRSVNGSGGLWIAAIAIVLLPAVAWVLPRIDSYPPAIPAADSGVTAADRQLLSPDLRWTPHYPGTAWEQRFALRTGSGNAVEVYGNRYHEQSQGNELVSRGSNKCDPRSFSAGSSGIVDLRDSQDRPIPARREVLTDRSGSSWLTLYTYLVDDEPIPGSRRVQLATAFRSVYSRPTAGVVAVAAPCPGECTSLSADLAETFVAVLEDYRTGYSE